MLTLGALAAGAGIGGGGLFVPIYWLILGVGPKAAVPLSKATILGGAIGNFVSIGRARHPKADRPMIDYEASTFMQSGELLGVIFGVLLNMLLPSVFIIVFLVMILSYNALRTFRKGFAARKKEDAATAAAKGFPDEKKTETKEGMTVVSVDSVEVKEDAGDEKEGAPDTTDHTSSCSFMILFTALSGVVQYVSQDKLGWQLMLFCIGIGFVSGQLGQRLVNKVIKKTGRPSYVIFLLAAIIGAACVSMTISGIAKIALDIVDGDTAADIFRFSTDDFKCND